MFTPHINDGARLFVSTVLPVAEDQAGFEALLFTQIKGVRSTGDIGERQKTVLTKEVGVIPYNEIVGRDANRMLLEVIVISDVGQTILKSSYQSSAKHAYQYILVDGTVYYFVAVCSERMRNAGKSKTVAGITTVLEFTSELLEI